MYTPGVPRAFFFMKYEIAEKWVQLFSTPYFLVTAMNAMDTFS